MHDTVRGLFNVIDQDDITVGVTDVGRLVIGWDDFAEDACNDVFQQTEKLLPDARRTFADEMIRRWTVYRENA